MCFGCVRDYTQCVGVPLGFCVFEDEGGMCRPPRYPTGDPRRVVSLSLCVRDISIVGLTFGWGDDRCGRGWRQMSRLLSYSSDRGELELHSYCTVPYTFHCPCYLREPFTTREGNLGVCF